MVKRTDQQKREIVDSAFGADGIGVRATAREYEVSLNALYRWRDILDEMKRTDQQKREIVDSAFRVDGIGALETARKYGVSKSALYRWRDKFGVGIRGVVSEAKAAPDHIARDESPAEAIARLRRTIATIDKMIPAARARERAERRLEKLADGISE